MNKIIKILIWNLVIILLLVCSLSLSNMILTRDSFKEYCSGKFAGIVNGRYCVYTINGTSYSFGYDMDWIRENTDFFGMLKKEAPKEKTK